MSAGDKNILAFANRNSLQHKQTRAYGAGAVCISDGLFYEANNDIGAGTAFTEGDTGQTWKLVGSKPIEDWSGTGANYKEGDQVFYLGSLLECKTDNTATTFNPDHWTVKVVGDPVEWVGSVAYPAGTRVYYKKSLWAAKSNIASTVTTFVKASWDLVGGIVNELDFTFGDITLNNVKYPSLVPVTAFGVTLGSDDKPFAAVVTEGINFYAGTSYLGNIDADSDSLGIYSGLASNTTKTLKLGIGNNIADLEIKSDRIECTKPVVIENNKGLIIKDGDETGRESWKFDVQGNNGLAISYLDSSESAEWILRLDRENSEDYRLIPNGGSVNEIYLGENNDNGRYTRLYTKNSTSVSSDERLKEDIEDLPDSLLEVWLDYVKPKSYKYKKLRKKDSISKTHCGVIAQEVIKAFDVAGLDWNDWDIVEKGSDGLFSVSYDHVQIIEMAAIRRKLGL